jgi:hypothetical protein
MTNSRFYNNLKRQVEENPILAIAAAAALLTATSKLMDANTARTAAKTHAKEVARRVAMQNLR